MVSGQGRQVGRSAGCERAGLELARLRRRSKHKDEAAGGWSSRGEEVLGTDGTGAHAVEGLRRGLETQAARGYEVPRPDARDRKSWRDRLSSPCDTLGSSGMNKRPVQLALTSS